MPPPTEWIERARELLSELSRVQPMRRGSLGERYVKCSKPGCACGQEPKARHGPYLSLTRKVGGSTQSRFLTPEQAELVRGQIQAAREFRSRLEAFWELCEQWADAELQGSEADSPGAVEKGGSRRDSAPRSRKRSRRS
jgi:hypothetical protein